jgi:uncharacterized protein YxeA
MKKIIIIAIFAIVLVGVGAYILRRKNNDKVLEPVIVETAVTEKQTENNYSETTIVSGGEDSTTEVFKNQPGTIKSITNQGDSQWLLSVDLLTRNTHWVPGGQSDFFLNQNTKVRNLFATKETKTYECNGVNADALRNTSKFMSDIQAGMIKRDEEAKKFGTKAYDYTSYFDINGSNIIAIYQQCLP